ncbi:23S rRNA (adenine(2030)-N(6))-methyltransferase RlmJ [Roseibium denhamense]|uniref:Ribosomal RNA large subunit methyltransferase J n=1 Tax=Roseibium denhamense TaxID=76305 RepID=A0ABY1NFM8_9HYPH|nr:23S rRNA (adenine(2030)-N(6))-methyltransferase RlmJ [Roseibium denhamense]MTI04272.1 23S rRNA (adenine(2030)-N(6))-methyltransferase RlmJ [Roseibium denhamense]SMP07864.1 23S rRNA (adenine2030-N6)-methyltransferase [Roseibium denhamense]
MNYRHAYHAGNIGDVLKHAVLARLIVYFQRKDKAFRIIDTHAGIGKYDLTAEETQKTGEWQQGIGKVLSAEMPQAVTDLLAPWLEAVRALNPDGQLIHYPGSPLLARMLARKIDRLTFTELHPADFKTLAAHFQGDYQVKTIHLDGWLALGSFLPPKEKRGLVLIDPAFEAADEFDRMTAAVINGWKKWQGGTYAIWYPMKDGKAIRRMHEAFVEAGLRDVLALQLNAGKSGPDTRMLGSGMTLINPPFTLAGEMETLLPWLCNTLHLGPGASWTVEAIAGE